MWQSCQLLSISAAAPSTPVPMAWSASCRVQISSGELRELGKVTVNRSFTLREKSRGISSIHLDYSLVWENLGWVTVYLLHRRWTVCAVPWFLRRALRYGKTSLYGFRIASQSQYVILFPCLSLCMCFWTHPLSRVVSTEWGGIQR